jgi:hypothetical protein
MERDATRENTTPDPEETRRRLTSEVAEVESAIALVASSSATRITIAGLRFGGQLAEHFSAVARSKGLRLEPLPWPDDSGCDLVVWRSDE